MSQTQVAAARRATSCRPGVIIALVVRRWSASYVAALHAVRPQRLRHRRQRAVGAADGPAGGAHEDRGLHDQRLLLGARRGPALASTCSPATACTRSGMELDAIAAVVIGGTLLTGGSGYLVGTVLGVLVLGVIQTLITFDGTLSSWWTRDRHRRSCSSRSSCCSGSCSAGARTEPPARGMTRCGCGTRRPSPASRTLWSSDVASALDRAAAASALGNDLERPRIELLEGPLAAARAARGSPAPRASAAPRPCSPRAEADEPLWIVAIAQQLRPVGQTLQAAPVGQLLQRRTNSSSSPRLHAPRRMRVGLAHDRDLQRHRTTGTPSRRPVTTPGPGRHIRPRTVAPSG